MRNDHNGIARQTVRDCAITTFPSWKGATWQSCSRNFMDADSSPLSAPSNAFAAVHISCRQPPPGEMADDAGFAALADSSGADSSSSRGGIAAGRAHAFGGPLAARRARSPVGWLC